MKELITKCNRCKKILSGGGNRIIVIGSINPMLTFAGDFCDKCANEFHRIVEEYDFIEKKEDGNQP